MTFSKTSSLSSSLPFSFQRFVYGPRIWPSKREVVMGNKAKRVRSHDRHDQVAVAINTIKVNQELRDYITERDLPAHLEKELAKEFPGDLNV